MALLDDLQWRHATKAYLPGRMVSDEEVEKIVEAARLAPSSSGLQPFRLIVVKDKAVKEQLAGVVFNSEAMRDCSHVLVFAAWNRYTAERIDDMFALTADERGLPHDKFRDYAEHLKGAFLNQSAEENFAHTARQTYIALGLALAQAAELRISSTPAEGFDNAGVDAVLGLEELGLRSVTLLYLGYSDPERDWMAPMKKVRTGWNDFAIVR